MLVKITMMMMIKRMTIATDNDGDEDVLVYRPDCSHDISHWVVTLNQKGNDHVDSHYYYNDDDDDDNDDDCYDLVHVDDDDDQATGQRGFNS